MSIVAVTGLRGAPGATSLALDLARAAGPDSLLLEADPDGGCLAARLDLGVSPGLNELAGAARAGIAGRDLVHFAQSAAGLAVIVAHPAAEQVHAALRAAGAHIAASLRELTTAVIVDCGRLRPGSPALAFAAVADRTLIVSGNGVEAAVALAHCRQVLTALASPAIVLTAARPFATGEVSRASGATIWGVVPDAPMAGVGRRARRTRQARGAAVLALRELCLPSSPLIAPSGGRS